jgi:signal transduction histidine kinase
MAPVDPLDAPPPRRGDALLNRLGVTGVVARDALLAGVVLVLTLGLVALGLSDVAGLPGVVVDQRGVLVALLSAQALLLMLRRTWPVLCLALVVGCQVVLMAQMSPDLSVRALAPIVAAYTVGTRLPTRRALAVVGALAGAEVLAVLVLAPRSAGLPAELLQHVLDALISYVVPALVGLSVTTRRRYLELLRVRAAEAVRAQQATTRAAIVAERARMARELHDVAAHHLSGMVVQAAAVERLVDRDPEAAKAGAAWLRTQGRRTLDDLRLAVGVLREGPEDGRAPVPGLADLDDLVATARDLGADVTLERSGSEVALGPPADAALYRAVQEALANARQHAPGAPVRVAVAATGSALTVTVVNDAPPEPPVPLPDAGTPHRDGAGLIGMRERAQLVGAALDVGPQPTGGWAVRVRLPLDAATAAAGEGQA